MNGWMDGWMDGWTNGRTDGRTDDRTEERMHKRTNERTSGRMNEGRKEYMNIALRRFLHNHGDIATEGSPKPGLCRTLISNDFKGSL